MCNQPDLHSNADKHEQYFSLLLATLKPILDENIINVFEKKLTELALSKDPNFVWCIQVSESLDFRKGNLRYLKQKHFHIMAVYVRISEEFKVKYGTLS